MNGRCIPICDETELPEGEVCYDEGDPDDCEPGFINKGFGCEPEECPEGQVGTPPDCEVPPGILPPLENDDIRTEVI